MEKLTKAALVEHMVKEMGEGVTKKEAAAALDALCRVIPAQMAAGNAVVLPGIGSLEVKQRPERQGRNPRTKETIVIPSAKVPTFKASKILKDALNGKSVE